MSLYCTTRSLAEWLSHLFSLCLSAREDKRKFLTIFMKSSTRSSDTYLTTQTNDFMFRLALWTCMLTQNATYAYRSTLVNRCLSWLKIGLCLGLFCNVYSYCANQGICYFKVQVLRKALSIVFTFRYGNGRFLVKLF